MFNNLANYKLVTTANKQTSFAKVPNTSRSNDNANSFVTHYSTPKKIEANVINKGSLKDARENKINPKHVNESFYANNYQTTVYPQQINFTSPISPQQNFTTFLESFVNTTDAKNLRYKYRDIYYFDNICGTAVDLRSELPFSEFSLSGVSDPTVLKKYEEALQELKPLQFLRRVLVDYFVYGISAHWFLFDDVRKIFSSPVALDLDRCTFINTPLLNDAPFIDYQQDESLMNFINYYNNGDERVRDYITQRPALLKLVSLAKDAVIKLDPACTLYLERNDLSHSNKMNVSYYSRVLKYYEYEKRLFRGTLDLAEKRLKSILHLMIGNDTILPGSDTLAEISNAFKSANLDPTDAIVATHHYVQTNEIRQPTDFWRWDEASEFINRGKMVALGINEQFLSGEMNYASMESALSVFLEQLLWDRTYVTDKVFNKMIFPYIAKENGFVKKENEGSNDAIKNLKINIRNPAKEMISKDIILDPLLHTQQKHRTEEYQIPTITWHKTLKPKVDKEWMDTLAILKDQGIPVPYRMWLTASGINVDELLSEYEVSEEDSIESKAKSYKDRFEVSDDFSNNFNDEDFNADESPEDNTDQNELGIEEDIFKDNLETPKDINEIESPLKETPEVTTKEPTTETLKSLDNPKLFQGASIKNIGIKNRQRMGALNDDEVKERMRPTIEYSGGKKRPASNDELEIFDNKFNKILAAQLAEKDEKDQALQKLQFEKVKETQTKHIIY